MIRLMKTVVIVGAGPGGLTAAYLLTKQKNVSVTVLEADPEYVGGISKTASYKGYRFDIGGHRFFSKSAEVEALWTEILGPDLLNRPRKSRIYYRRNFYSYPLKPIEALFKLGIVESVLCVLSYFHARLFPKKDAKSFEDWVTNQFGKRLFRIFFKTYTEKVWGMSCQEISADWAAQRIKGLSLVSAVLSAFKPKPRNKGQEIKTLIDSFRYPRLGPGMMWERCASLVQEQGGKLLMGTRMTRLKWLADTKQWAIAFEGAHAGEMKADDVILTSPLGSLAHFIHDPDKREKSVETPLRSSCNSLRYRDFVTVALIVKKREEFDDNWIYIHDPGVRVGRIQNFRSWSPEMVPNPDHSCYGLEYFCQEGDRFWTAPDDELIELASRELIELGLAQEGDILDGCILRQEKAYPVYDHTYREHVEEIRSYVDRNYRGLHFVGRNGMHKYNNQDHSMMTAMLAAHNIASGEALFDVWKVNEDAEYHESGHAGSESSGASGLRFVPIAPAKPEPIAAN